MVRFCKVYILSLLCCVINSSFALSNEIETSVSGEGRVRWEYKNNTDYSKTSDDRDDFVGSRFRLNFNFDKIGDKAKIFIQPQVTRVWGQKVFQNSGSTTVGSDTVPTGGEKVSSGGLVDQELSVHQAYIQSSLSENSHLILGRQELAYGDHLVVGNVGWSNVGRAFDAAKVHTQFEKSWFDIFWSEVVESNNGSTDRSFSGIYANLDWTSSLKAFELYVFYDNDKSSKENTTYGNRIVWANDSTGVNLEYTGQSRDGFQADTTIHHKISGPLDLGVGYFYANKDYSQLFPTAHKWLGTGDFYSRRNIQGPRVFINYTWNEQWKSSLSFHSFNRVSDKDPAYTFSGGAIGAGSEVGSHIADEFDLSMNFNQNASVSYQFGGSLVSPGEYIKNAIGSNDSGEFFYVSASIKL